MLQHLLVSRLMCTLSPLSSERNKHTTHHMNHVHLCPSFVQKLIYTVTSSYYRCKSSPPIITTGLRSVSNGNIQQHLFSDSLQTKKKKKRQTTFKFRPQSKQTACFLPFTLGLVSDFPQIYNSLECTK